MTLQQIRYAIMVSNTNSMNEAAKKLYITQPSLSSAMKELENEVGIQIFHRTTKGVNLTEEGKEFLGYAKQILDQVELLEERYSDSGSRKKHFGVSTQHYSFAVKAFVETVQSRDMKDYECAIRETKTMDVLRDVRDGRSEIGVLYLNDFNEKVMQKLFRDHVLEFHKLFDCKSYVYLWKNHPLASKQAISMKDLDEFPCLSFEQGENHSFYLAEEILSTYEYKKTIKACDRATILNLMVGLNGYTLCSGIICEELNGSDCVAIPLKSAEVMHIGYVTRKKAVLSTLGESYIEEMMKFAQYTEL
ncbi:MAG: LysR family transcriptional regulator [Hespellia sp.]|nr:LysR family transcriptional regulator [Hespellia sp.]